jgi:perosamine synthetase
MSKEKQYWHDILGYNYRMTNVQAAIGVAQMERLPEILQKKRELADQYKAFLDDIPLVGYQGQKEWALNSYWMFSILLDEKSEISKTELMKVLSSSGIETRPLFYPLHTMPLYQSYCIDNKSVVSKYLSERGLSLPSSVDLDKEVVHRVTEVIRKNVV